MNFKRNFKMYVKNKETKIAFGFFMAFLLIIAITFIPSVNLVHGVRDDFTSEKIEVFYSNNYDTTYLVGSKNNVYYSQYKGFENSHLNKFADIEDLSNEYGDATTHEYNFIKLDLSIDSPIIKVGGLVDNINGGGGYTLILTQDGHLYYLSSTTKTLTLLLNDIVDFNIMYHNVLIKDKQNNLNYYYIEDARCLYKIDLNIQNANQYFFTDYNNEDNLFAFMYQVDNEIYKLSMKYEKEEQPINENYPVIELNGMDKTTTQISNIGIISKTASVDENTLILNDKNELYYYDNGEFSIIDFDNKVDDIYACGAYAFIVKSNKQTYYLGDIKIDEDVSFDHLKKLDYDNKEFYASSNGVFIYKNNILYLYNEKTNTFDGMYVNFFFSYVARYFSIFVCVMIIIYFLMSYYEASKRYNRYFSKSVKEKDENE